MQFCTINHQPQSSSTERAKKSEETMICHLVIYKQTNRDKNLYNIPLVLKFITVMVVVDILSYGEENFLNIDCSIP